MADATNARLMEVAQAIFVQSYGSQDAPIEVRLTSGPDRQIVLTIPFQHHANGQPLPNLSPLERDILRVVQQAGRPVVAKTIAARLNTPYDGGLRAILRNLTQREPPVLASDVHGYTAMVGERAPSSAP